MDRSKNKLQSMLDDAMHNAKPIWKVSNLTETEYRYYIKKNMQNHLL